MSENNRYEHIPLLIAKQLVGNITDEEHRLLDDWRRQSPFNEEAFQRLMDKQVLDIELRRARLTDPERPLADMKHRINTDSHGHRMRKLISAAAVVLLIIGAGVLLWNRQQSQERQTQAQAEIRPGTIQAVLTRPNGETTWLNAEADLDKLQEAGSLTGQTLRNAPSAKAGDETALWADLATPRGGEFRVTLEDGTEVWLNADTHLRYPEQFAQGERRVEVSGEAYFKVAKDESRPFYVVSGGQEVRVYGTEFNINAYEDQPAVYTTLVEGSISLRLSGEYDNARELLLTPGHQTTFNVQHSTFNVQTVDTDVVTSWRSGTFVFEDQTMEQIMRTLSRWYDFQYEFASPALAETVFMGSIPRYGSFAEVARIFEKMGGIHLRQKSDKVIISEK